MTDTLPQINKYWQTLSTIGDALICMSTHQTHYYYFIYYTFLQFIENWWRRDT